MSNEIPWLPPLITITVTHSSQLEVFFKRIFLEEFVNKNIQYLDYPIIINKQGDPTYSDKLFEHLTTRDNPRGESRGIDIERAKRLLWCPAIIEHSTDSNILNFDYLESNGIIRTYLYLKPCILDYLVILQKIEKSHEAIIVSAYFVDEEYKRHKYIEKSKKRV